MEEKEDMDLEVDSYTEMSDKEILINICKSINTIKNILLFYLLITVLAGIGVAAVFLR